MHRLSSLSVACLLLAGCSRPPHAPPDRGVADSVSVMDSAVDGEQGCITPPDLRLESLPDIRPAPRDSAADGAADARLDAPPPDAIPDGPAACPPGMVLVSSTLCMDRYEASRPDATASSQGTQSGLALSKAGVIPWHSYGLSKAEAGQACAAAGKRLCTLAEWYGACAGPQNQVYAYGQSYNPTICNGIDTFCLCGAGQACEGVSPCPYPHCFNQPPPGGGPPAYCGAWFHVTPTGSFPACVNGAGVFDLNGNVWELADTSDGLLHFRGGAYNCGDSEALHRCDHDGTWGPSAQGFRCCADPLPAP